MIIKSHLPPEDWLPVALLGEEERVEAAGRWCKSAEVKTFQNRRCINATVEQHKDVKSESKTDSDCILCFKQICLIWFNISCVHIFLTVLLVDTLPPNLQPSNSTKKKPFFEPIPRKRTRPPFSDCSCCSIICKRDWRDDETARGTVFSKNRTKLKSLTSRFPCFFYNIFLLNTKEVYNFKCWETFLQHVDLTEFDILDWLIGYGNSSTMEPFQRPPVEHHCEHWWLLLLERQGLVQRNHGIHSLGSKVHQLVNGWKNLEESVKMDGWWASSNKIRNKQNTLKKLTGFNILSSSRPFPLSLHTLFFVFVCLTGQSPNPTNKNGTCLCQGLHSTRYFHT